MLGLYLDVLESAHEVDVAEERSSTRRQNDSLRKSLMSISEVKFRKRYRLSTELFARLVEKLSPHILAPLRSDGLDVETKILIALSFYATGSYQTPVGDNKYHPVSQASVSKAVKEVTAALNKPQILNGHVSFPFRRSDRDNIKRSFYRATRLPGVLGCVDGTHVAIVTPARHEERYINRKGYHSLNVLIMCDSELKIMCVDSSYPGSTHDSRVWEGNPLKGVIERLYEEDQEDVYILGDSGYPLRATLMTPIVNAEQGSPEAYYTDLHVSARSVVERCIGVLKARFRYIYSDHINLTNLRDACDLHNAAFKWRLPYLKEMCIKFISSSLNADNVICIYELACKSKEFHLQDDCIKIFKTLTKEILNAESFKEAKLSTVLKIFSMDTLNIDSELDLFKAAVNHAAAQEVEDEGLKRSLDHSENCFTPEDGLSSAKRSRIDSTGLDNVVEIETNSDTTSDAPAVNASTASSRQESHYVAEHDYAEQSPRENDMTAESYADYEDKLLKANLKATRREKYLDVMRKIRFLTLTPQEFAECTTLSFLLRASAIMALSLNISAKDTFVPMPKHFSTSMVPRNLSQQNEREKQAGTTRITVNNIRNLKKFESNPFYIRNLAWTLMLLHLQETVEDINKDILIIAVTCFFEKGVPEWIGKVEARVSFISENDINDRFQDMKLKLSQPCNDYGAWIIKTEWNDLMSAHSIIEDNTVTCKVYVSTNIQKSPTSPDSSPDNTQTDYITTPLRSSTPVSRAPRYLKEKTQNRSDLTASGLPEKRSLTPLLPEKRSLTPLLPEKRSLTPLLPEKRSSTPLLPEKRSLTPLLPEKRSLTPLLPEKRSLTPLLPEKRSLTPLLSEKGNVPSPLLTLLTNETQQPRPYTLKSTVSQLAPRSKENYIKAIDDLKKKN